MNEGPGSSWPGGDPPAGPGKEPLTRFVGEFGLRLPRFEGPLVAFDPAPNVTPVTPCISAAICTGPFGVEATREIAAEELSG